jgi:carbonic anhydrase
MNAPDDDALRSAIRDAGGPDTSDVAFGAAADQQAALREDVARVRAEPRLAHLAVGGFVYDVDTGRVARAV